MKDAERLSGPTLTNVVCARDEGDVEAIWKSEEGTIVVVDGSIKCMVDTP